MFERYTERARRTIFFARYEASQLGSPYIESEHLLRGLLREDKRLTNQFLRSHRAIESIRKKIEEQTTVREKVSTSVDLPLSRECMRVLTYGAEEAKRLNHKRIDTPHLLFGLLREEKSFAAQLLRDQGVALDSVREQVRHLEGMPAQGGFASIVALDRWLVEREAHCDIWAVTQKGISNNTTHVAIYARDQPNEKDDDQDLTPAERLVKVQARIDFIS
jgi:ATP-dependent Clp protease ATP-binding subunit ClpA